MQVNSEQRMPGAKPAGRVDALDLLRLLAVAAVVLFHYGFNGPTTNGTTYVALSGLGSFARYGYLGVQLFFTVSGFVIAFSAQGRTATEFLIARISRIYPAFLFCMTLTFLVCVAFGAPEFHVTIKQYLGNLFIGAPAFGQTYVDLVYWTLILELTFYGWIFLLMLTGQMKWLPTMIVPLWLAMSLVNETMVHSHVLTKIFLTDQSGFFATGVMLHEVYRGCRDAFTQIVLGFAAMVAVTQGVLNSYLMSAQFNLLFNPYTVAAICAGIVMLVTLAVQARGALLPASVAAALGGMTYPLYLFHHQAGYVAIQRIDGGRHSVPIIAGIFATLVAIALLNWRFIDRPGQRLMKKLLSGAVARFDRNPFVLRRKALVSFPK